MPTLTLSASATVRLPSDPVHVYLLSSKRNELHHNFWRLVDDATGLLNKGALDASSRSLGAIPRQDMVLALAELGFSQQDGVCTFDLPAEIAWNPTHQEGLAALLVGGCPLLAQVMKLQRTSVRNEGPSINTFKALWGDSLARRQDNRHVHPAAKAIFEHAEKLFHRTISPVAASRPGCFRAHGWLYLAMLETHYPIEDIKAACALAKRSSGVRGARPEAAPARSSSVSSSEREVDRIVAAMPPSPARAPSPQGVPKPATPEAPRRTRAPSAVPVLPAKVEALALQAWTLNGWPLQLTAEQASWLSAGSCPSGTDKQQEVLMIGDLRATLTRRDLLAVLERPPQL